MIPITKHVYIFFWLNVICPNIGPYQKTLFQFNIEKQRHYVLQSSFCKGTVNMYSLTSENPKR